MNFVFNSIEFWGGDNPIAKGKGIRMVEDGEREAVLYRMMRWQPEQVIAVRFKCETSEIARVLTDGGAEPFAPLDPEDPMMQAVCSRS